MLILGYMGLSMAKTSHDVNLGLQDMMPHPFNLSMISSIVSLESQSMFQIQS
jgi:hypothetical protein